MPEDTAYNHRIVRYEEIHDIRADDFRAFVESVEIRPAFRILDCGCGYGACTREILAKRLGHENVSVDLVDESETQIAWARRELAPLESVPGIQLRFRTASFPDNFAPDEQYDLVLAKMVLHEVRQEKQKAFVEALHRSLVPGGVLLLWDVSLPTEGIRAFVQSAVRAKDLLAGLGTLAERRNLNTEAEIQAYLDEAGFVFGRQFRTIDYVLDTRRRLEPELGNDESLLVKWHERIRADAKGCPEGVLRTIRYVDQGDTIQFVIRKSLYRLERADTRALTLRPFAASTSIDTDDSTTAEPVFRDVFESSSGLPMLVRTLRPKFGLIRPTVLTRSRDGQRRVCDGSFEYLYNWSRGDGAWIIQARAFLSYMAWVKCALQHTSGVPSIQSMSDGISAALADCPTAAYVLTAAEGSNAVRMIVGTYAGVAGEAIVRIEGDGEAFFDAAAEALTDWNIGFSSIPARAGTDLGPEEAWRLVVTLMGDAQGIDKVAASLTSQLIRCWRRPQEDRFGVSVVHATGAIEKLLQHKHLLVPLAEYLRRSGTPYCYYMLPPSPLVGHEESHDVARPRLEEGALIVSSSAELSGRQLSDSLCYVAGLWAGLGAIDAKLSERLRQGQERDRELARSAYGVGHFLGNRLIETRSSADILRRKPVGSKFTADTQRKAEQAFYQADAAFKTSRLMHFMANLITRAANDQLEERFYRPERYQIGTGLEKMARACNLADDTALVLSPGSSDEYRGLAIDGFLNIGGKRVRFFNELYDELLFEVLFNASKYAAKGQCLIQIHTDDRLFRPWRNAQTAMVISNWCDDPPKLDEICRADMLEVGWFAVDGRRDTGLGFLQSCLELSNGGAVYVRACTEEGRPSFQLRVELAGLVRTGGHRKAEP